MRFYPRAPISHQLVHAAAGRARDKEIKGGGRSSVLGEDAPAWNYYKQPESGQTEAMSLQEA